jgi:hypothetical protein
MAKGNTKQRTDQEWINVCDSQAVRYWCRKLACTQSDLRAAVKWLGPVPTVVEKYLKRRAANG